MNNDSEYSDSTTMIITEKPKKYSHDDKKLLVKRIEDIKSKNCYIKIFRLIHNDKLKYTKNDNGVFFNIANLDDKLLNSIDNLVKYYEMKKQNSERNAINSINNSENDVDNLSSVTYNQ
jgi:hypothetical protein